MAGQRDGRGTAGRDAAERVGWLAGLGAVGAAFAASLCCIGPILFVTAGVGAGLGSSLEPLRPALTALAGLALAVGFYAVYGRNASVGCAPGEACVAPAGRRRGKVILWTATALTVVLWSFSYWSTVLL